MGFISFSGQSSFNRTSGEPSTARWSCFVNFSAQFPCPPSQQTLFCPVGSGGAIQGISSETTTTQLGLGGGRERERRFFSTVIFRFVTALALTQDYERSNERNVSTLIPREAGCRPLSKSVLTFSLRQFVEKLFHFVQTDGESDEGTPGPGHQGEESLSGQQGVQSAIMNGFG